ncbi:type 2 periplasmic-binding domain-containing protein [Mycoplasma bradburyae]|uniref:spermidine/putrescine ABC transporter substrate-binding protein n=1 Tax=Mycoplasma bradburyae TaxID=2963128 RepID=UPI0020CECC33|nr:spermidine/putrescine ABC transporter substrate-binding protein [Mycoplasma bradburyae]UTS70581.1 spermidine/putrescine ABC transporter substrate-binding protein [Mycoplasma bradburyae]
MKKKPLKTIFSALTLSAFLVTSCGEGGANSNLLNKQFVYGNFESYMSPNLQKQLLSEYNNLQFNSVPSNENLITNFKNKTFTIGTASTYAVIDLIRQGSLIKLDWTKFNLSYLNDEDQLVKINNANDALDLFTDQVKEILTSYSIKGEKINLLDYSVPYFFQSFVFAYRGPKIASLVDHESSWYDIISTITNEKHRARFNNNKLGIVEDERSLYSVANLIKTAQDNQEITVNPKSNQLSQAEFYNVYKAIADAGLNYHNLSDLNKSTTLLNSDSSVIYNNLASRRVNAAIMFNGDAIYSAQGGEYHSDKNDPKKPTSEDFHIITPKYTPLALDLIVINKSNIDQYPSFLDQSYKIIRKVALEGLDQDLDNFQAELKDEADSDNQEAMNDNSTMMTEANESTESMNNNNMGGTESSTNPMESEGSENKEEESDESDDVVYKYGPLENFNYVQYTSPLKKISDPEKGLVAKEGWLDVDGQDELSENINSAYFIENVADVNRFIESPINDIQKASLINAYARFKSDWWK